MLDSLFLGAAVALGQGQALVGVPAVPGGDAGVQPVTVLAPPAGPGQYYPGGSPLPDPPTFPGSALPALAMPALQAQPSPRQEGAESPRPAGQPTPGTTSPKAGGAKTEAADPATPGPRTTPQTPATTTPDTAPSAEPEVTKTPEAVNITAPLLPPAEEKKAEEAAAEEESSATRYLFMRSVQGTWVGSVLDDNRMSISGWITGSYNGSEAQTVNTPVVWHDRANRFLLQQAWVRFERSVVTSGTSNPTVGFRLDLLGGSDYRFTIMRGLFNGQLEVAERPTNPGADFIDFQNLYGIDPIQFYVNAYVPTLFKGTEFRAGRLWTPFGVESLEAVSTPLISRSYAFNFCPPFTHMGVAMYPKFSDTLSGVFMLANGNDVFFVPEQEPRFVGAITWAPNASNNITFGTSVGRGVFNTSRPNLPSTIALQFEPAGRNNINVFDVVYNHIFTPKLSYAIEGIYGYQSSVPSGNPAPFGGALDGNKLSTTAHWGSVAQYLTYQPMPWLKSVTRFEIFDDALAQRTGFEGVYYSITQGIHFPLKPGFTWRNEVRYDYNNRSRPFLKSSGASEDLLTAATEFQFRY